MSEYPNLKGVATKDLVSQIGTGSYKADYINWSHTMQLLRDHAPGWLPELMQTTEGGGYVHRAGIGGYLLIRFVHQNGDVTPGFPQAIMDNRNASIPLDKITSRDITDTHRRGTCMAAALAFGLAYELWAKMPLESGYESAPPGQSTAKAPADEPEREREPGAGLTEEQYHEIAVLVGDLAKLRGTTVEAVTSALTTDNGELTKLSEFKAGELLGKLRRWKTNLEASAGEQASGAAPSAGGEQDESPADAPAEESSFKAPTGPRGKPKAKAA